MIPPRPQTQKGVALIIVLLLVVLTTIMVVAFLGSVKTETSATRAVVGVQNSRQLADLAVQTVISQIQQATQTSSTRPAGTVSWASQPGMIRCYDSTGAEIEWYKLYSAQNMTVVDPSPSVALIQADLPETSGTSGNWATPGSANYGVFTDLNSPVTAADGKTLEYPIMNPAAATSIASAAGTTTNAVLGFDIQNPPGYSASTGVSSATNNQAAMPVRWLYVLQNGTMVPGVATGTPGTVTVTGASSSNPIVGRVAFWTDDETCKLNVNTAADGTYYDTPRFESPSESTSLSSVTPTTTQDAGIVIDRQMAKTPPVFNEFQRFIGQPAQTRLSYVLGTTISNSGNVNKSHLLTLLSPFMQWGGSAGGVIDELTSGSNTMATPTRQTPYASLDEWMFSTQLNSSLDRVVSPGDTSGNPAPLLTNTRLQQLRFFLSANSDAPEVNLFGQPRICMWPIYTTDLGSGSSSDPGNAFPTTAPGTNYVTTFDKLIATAATLTGSSPRGIGLTPSIAYPYYFGRQNAASPFIDWQGTNASPPTLSSMTATRNQNIFKYLRTYASKPIPGYGTKFTSKYGSPEMDQILTEIFDYCRSLDPADLLATSPYASSGQATSPAVSDGGAQVTPIVIKKTNFGNAYATKGFGRFDTINEITLDFTHDIPAYNADGSLDTTHINVTGSIYLSLYSPSMGYVSLNPHLRIVVQTPNTPGTITMNVTGSDGTSYPVFGSPNNGASGNSGRTVFSAIPMPPNPKGNNNGWNNGPSNSMLWGGVAGARQLLLLKNSSYTNGTAVVKGNTITVPNTPNSSNYELSGLNMRIPTSCTSLSMAPTNLEIKIYHTDALPTDTTANGGGDGYDGVASTDLVQDITVKLPGFTSLPMPTTIASLQNLGNRLDGGGLSVAYCDQTYPNCGLFIAPGDIVQSVVGGYNGDLRLIAAQSTINDTTVTTSQSFVPHPQANKPSQPMAHSQCDIFPHWTQPGYSNPSTGQLVPSASYRPYQSSGNSGFLDSPTTGFIDSTLAGLSGSPNFTGDWDNGWGGFPDGPYINKADETGAQYQTSSTVSVYGADPYYIGEANAFQSAFCSPNRVVASPVMFGSLPTGVPINGSAAVPWQTLLFRPQAGHIGENPPEDELLLDWFWMPVVEPYAISSTFDTAGKVNMNYQIAPFTYITRATALMGVLGSEYVIAAPTTAGLTYKTKNAGSYSTYRTPVKVLEADNYTLGSTTGTFVPFQQRFASGEIFRSAAEICDIYLVPQGQSWTSWASGGPGSPAKGTDPENFWAANQLSGDNTRERPYNGLYSRLTTKSNTYMVHVRAQALKSPSTLPANEWIENPQQVVSEYRGSVTVNRYIDPQDTNIPDFLTPTSSATGTLSYSLDNYYKYRVLEKRQFLP